MSSTHQPPPDTRLVWNGWYLFFYGGPAGKTTVGVVDNINLDQWRAMFWNEELGASEIVGTFATMEEARRMTEVMYQLHRK